MKVYIVLKVTYHSSEELLEIFDSEIKANKYIRNISLTEYGKPASDQEYIIIEKEVF